MPVLNTSNTITVQLSSQTWDEPWALIVVDNGSTDDSMRIAASHRKHVQNLMLMTAAEVRGPAHARNVGAAEATGTYLAFRDADDEAPSNWGVIGSLPNLGAQKGVGHVQGSFKHRGFAP